MNLNVIIITFKHVYSLKYSKTKERQITYIGVLIGRCYTTNEITAHKFKFEWDSCVHVNSVNAALFS